MSRKRIDYSLRGNLTLREAMEYAGIGHDKAKALIDAGDWQAYKSGRDTRVIKKSIDEWMAKEAAEFAKKGGKPSEGDPC
ncbi:MAG: helix-turn-helix domain-containing protein [Fimbriimonas sp.]